MNSLAEFPGIVPRLFLLFVVLLGLETLVVASPSQAAEYELPASEVAVRERLRDRKGKVRAWTIYHIGKEKRGAFLPDLIGFLDPDRSSRFEAQLALDALFKLEAVVPDDVLLRLADDFPDQAAVMLTIHPENHAEAIRAMFLKYVGSMNRGDNIRWVLVANLALRLRLPGLAKLILEQRLNLSANTVTVDVDLYRNKIPPPGSPGGAVCGCGIGYGAGPTPPVLPPLTAFKLETDPRYGKLFVAGPTPVFLYTLEYPTLETEVGTPKGFQPKSDYGVMARPTQLGEFIPHEFYFDRMLETLLDRPVRLRLSDAMVWRGRRSLSRRIRSIRRKGDRNFHQVLQGLVARELLSSADAAAFRPRVVVRVLSHDFLRIPPFRDTLAVSRR